MPALIPAAVLLFALGQTSEPPSAATRVAATHVRLHLEPADGSVRVTDIRLGKVVCTSPCDAELPIDAAHAYRLEGSGGATEELDLARFTSRVTARYQAGMPALRTVGIVSAIFGAVTLAGGLLMAALWVVSMGFGPGISALAAPSLICSGAGLVFLIAGAISAAKAPRSMATLEGDSDLSSWY